MSNWKLTQVLLALEEAGLNNRVLSLHYLANTERNGKSEVESTEVFFDDDNRIFIHNDQCFIHCPWNLYKMIPVDSLSEAVAKVKELMEGKGK